MLQIRLCLALVNNSHTVPGNRGCSLFGREPSWMLLSVMAVLCVLPQRSSSGSGTPPWGSRSAPPSPPRCVTRASSACWRTAGPRTRTTDPPSPPSSAAYAKPAQTGLSAGGVERERARDEREGELERERLICTYWPFTERSEWTSHNSVVYVKTENDTKVFVCVHVCVVKERERERESVRVKERLDEKVKLQHKGRDGSCGLL